MPTDPGKIAPDRDRSPASTLGEDHLGLGDDFLSLHEASGSVALLDLLASHQTYSPSSHG